MNKSKYKGYKLLEKLLEKTYKKVSPRTLNRAAGEIEFGMCKKIMSNETAAHMGRLLT